MDNDSWVEIEGEGMVYWPRCTVPNCVNRICLAKGETRFCWPHSDSGTTVSEIIREGSKATA